MIVYEDILIIGYNFIPPQPSAICGIIVAIVVVDEGELGVVVLGGPLDGLGDISGGCYLPKGRVGVVGADVAVLAVYLTDVFCEVPTVGVPCAIFLDSQRAGGVCLRGSPRNQPQARVGSASEVAGLRGVAALAWQAGSSRHSRQSLRRRMVQRYTTIDGHLFGGAAAHVVVGAFLVIFMLHMLKIK